MIDISAAIFFLFLGAFGGGAIVYSVMRKKQ